MSLSASFLAPLGFSILGERTMPVCASPGGVCANSRTAALRPTPVSAHCRISRRTGSSLRLLGIIEGLFQLIVDIGRELVVPPEPPHDVGENRLQHPVAV